MADEQTPAPDVAEEATPPAEAEPAAAENGNEETPAAEESKPEEAPAEEAPQEETNGSSDAQPPGEADPAQDAANEEVKDSDAPADGVAPPGDEAAPTGEEGEATPADGAPVEGQGEGGEAGGEAGEQGGDTEQAEGGEGTTEDSPKEDGEAQETEGGEKEEGDADAKPEEGEGGEAVEKEEGQETSEEKPGSPIPQSDTFAEGERPETPVVAVTEPLSREGSPPPPGDVGGEQMQPGTPERMVSPLEEEDEGEEEEEEEEEEYYDEEDEVPWVTREELLEMYQAALTERETLQNQNVQLQHKLAEYFRKKKTDDQRQEMDKNVTDQEQRYLKYMSNLEDLRKQQEEEDEGLKVQQEELKDRRQEKLDWVEDEGMRFGELKKQVAMDAISSRSGKPIPQRDVELYLISEQKKEEEVKVVRLENIKLKNRLKKREQQLKAKEELAEGLHLIDFEQLKIENQTYNEKIEERNEELLKLRKKITSTVQVLTHVKEKLQFVQAENQVQKGNLKEVEATVAQKRDILSRTKKARDSLRIDNQRLRQKCGLLGNTPLLRDFEERKDEGDALRSKLDRLKRQHAELTLNCAGVRRKIDEARQGRS
ncbi:cilia- and flagella-associated protein 184-like [Amphiura filiformis]|uniref:cilia- and flagella-associated protein 184-like n=1 Tax=Amphiura filiformis TaxID=82378 RepID=UPI003B215AB5